MTKLVTGFSLSALLLLFGASAAFAQAYPPRPGPVVEVNVTVVTPNKIIRIDGSDWGPGTTVEITDRNPAASGASLGVADVADDGTFGFEVTVPAEARGTLDVVARGADAQGALQDRPLVLTVEEGLAAPAGEVQSVPAMSMLTPGTGLAHRPVRCSPSRRRACSPLATSP